MIYDGTSAHENGESSTDRRVTTKSFNSNKSDNAYFGYMYGIIGAESYEDTHFNNIDSTIKDYLENTWYANNISGTNYESYIADAIYCNDRKLVSGTGIATAETDYASWERISDNWPPTPILKCEQKNDRFTLKDSTINTTDGLGTNNKLDEPIGLITVDEVVMAGIWRVDDNPNSYLYIGKEGWWTMSPVYYFASSAFVWGCYGGEIYLDYSVSDELAVRPVISLKADALKYDAATSNGTMEYPFVIS